MNFFSAYSPSAVPPTANAFFPSSSSPSHTHTPSSHTPSHSQTHTGLKRERETMGEDDMELVYSRNKRMVHASFRSLSLSEEMRARNVSPVGDEDNAAMSEDIFAGEDNDNCGQEEDSSIALFRRSSVDSDVSLDNDTHTDGERERESEIVCVLKGGRRQYVRKIDFLVDELLRKKVFSAEQYGSSQRSLTVADAQMTLPSFVGPSARTDQRLLSLIVPPSVMSSSSSSSYNNNNNSSNDHPARSSAERESGRESSSHNTLTLTHTNGTGKAGFSGEKTHSDWEIEEVQPLSSPTTHTAHTDLTIYAPHIIHTDSGHNTQSTLTQEISDDDTDMACCDDASWCEERESEIDTHSHTPLTGAFSTHSTPAHMTHTLSHARAQLREREADEESMMMMDQEDERDRDTQPLAVSLYSPSHTTLAHTLYTHTAHSQFTPVLGNW